MQSFQKIHSKITPISLQDIDTDMIIPASFLTSTSKEGYGENCFRRLKDENPDFPLNNSRFSDSKILMTKKHFGCGSSREHAVWALMSAGFQVIIAPSFADIFKSNSGKNGLVLVELDEEIVSKLIESADNSDMYLAVDLEKQSVTLEDGTVFLFEFDPFRKKCILNGYDDLDYILSQKDKIEEFKAKTSC